MSDSSNARLLLELEKLTRDVNREVMHEAMPQLSLDSLKPIVTVVAQARLSYLRELVAVAAEDDTPPSYERIQQLAHYRERYEELVAGVQALERAIEHDYLDVIDHP
ncbi:MAG: hypothetical protein V2I82_00120 [Halieaceae bacterium]|jgi:hypothetical protein|nr:hypothetical protein [Halieaceae bacterium]